MKTGFLHRRIGWKTVAGWLIVLLVTTAPVGAEEITVQNDSLTDFSTAVIQAGFDPGETADAWLTSPCDGTIVAVQVYWKSLWGGAMDSLEDNITIYSNGTFPIPGPVKQVDYAPFAPAVMIGPVMKDGFLNEFRELDSDIHTPLSVAVTEGEVFVVSFKFYNDPDPSEGPSVVNDYDGCQTGKNGINGIWDACALGVSGDWAIRAVIECPGITGACCHATGDCTADVEEEDCQGTGDVWHEELGCGDITCTPRGACCREGGCLTLVEQAVCEGPLAGIYAGHDTHCVDDVCVAGACCDILGTCTEVFEVQCEGTFKGPGTSCDPNPCDQPLGACCIGTYCLADQTDEDCTGAGGEWVGPFTVCEPNPCEECAGILVGDFEIDTLVNGLDIQGFVVEFLDPGSPGSDGFCRADIDRDGVLDSDDIADFVQCLVTDSCPPS